MMKPVDDVTENVAPTTTTPLSQDIEGSFLKQPTTNSIYITIFLILNTMVITTI